MIEFIHDFEDAGAWDGYVETHPEGRFSHLFGYRCVEGVYGYRPRYCAFAKSGRLVGVLPMFEARSLFFGRRLVSQPFSEYGGLLLDADLADDEIATVVDHLRAFIRDIDIPSLEMHGNQGMPGRGDRLVRGNPQKLAYLTLSGPLDDIFVKVLSRHVRKALNKAERQGLVAAEANDPATIETHFYPLYLRSMARLGVPPHPLSYFIGLGEALRGKMRIFWALHDGKRVAGLLGFSCGKRVSIINIVSDEAYWKLRPNDLVHWEYIKWAHNSGFDYFDFGSVRYDGQTQFKKKWGCLMEDSGYFYVSEGARGKVTAFDSSSGRAKMAGRLWSRFMPSIAAVQLGPSLRKNLIR